MRFVELLLFISIFFNISIVAPTYNSARRRAISILEIEYLIPILTITMYVSRG